MIYKCKNCGGNVVYDPDRKAMHCPYCDGIETQDKAPGGGMELCANCGAPIEAGDYRSAVKCEYCGHYTIFDERVEGVYEPRLILPFKMGKAAAVSCLEKEFSRRVFVPESFLSQATVEKMEGSYIPFWLYDMKADCHYSGTGTTVRVWVSGDTEYTETSYFQVNRDVDVDFEKLPVDASLEMEDQVMDMMEPYQYEALENFRPEYMSGFLGEVYNQSAEVLEPRAEDRARKDASVMLHNTMGGYTTLIPQQETIRMHDIQTKYALLPVWWYRYSYEGQNYDCFVNGQTGKVIGKAPLCKKRIFAYSGTFFASLTIILMLIKGILEVL